MLLEPFQELKHTRLGCPFEARVIHILQSEPHARAQSPLEIIKDSLIMSAQCQLGRKGDGFEV